MVDTTVTVLLPLTPSLSYIVDAVSQTRGDSHGVAYGVYNVAWAIGCVTQARRHLTGQERSVELAILGRLGAEVEYEICRLLEKAGVS